MTGWAIYDSQCGCKLLKRDAYLKVKGDLVETRFAFDIDLLVNLLSVGARVREVPVDWSDVPGSKVSLVRDGFQMTHALWKLRGRMRRKTQMACEISDRP
jgi:dolichyl-phosphate beta-glucosyltransferase